MPPWLDWLDWLKWDCIGAGILGKILGVWFSFCISIVRKLFRRIVIVSKGSSRATSNVQFPHHDLPIQTRYSFWRKLTKISVSTILTLAVWGAITWKPVWLAAGPKGHRFFTVILMLTSAPWPISLLWIVFSTSIRKNISTTLQMRPQRYSGSNSAKAT